MFQINFAELSPEQVLSIAKEQLHQDIAIWQKNIWRFIQQWFSETEFITVFTSGSTGPPKEISHLKNHMKHSALLTCNALQLKKNDKALLCLPANKISGMMMLVRSAEQKMNLVCIEPSTTPLKHLPADLTLDFAAFTPMQFSSVASDNNAFNNAENISKIILGGENASDALLQKAECMRNYVYLTFGMTETISHIALKRISGEHPDRYYHTLSGITVAINSKNQLVVHAPRLGQVELVTNDEVRVISATQFEWLGRTDNVINSGGIKIHAEVMEHELRKKTDASFFIAAVASNKTGEEVAIALEQSHISTEEISNWKNLCAPFEKLAMPKHILLISKFDRTENGKINRKKSLQNVLRAYSIEI